MIPDKKTVRIAYKYYMEKQGIDKYSNCRNTFLDLSKAYLNGNIVIVDKEKKYKAVLEYISHKDYLLKIGNLDTLKKWVREFIYLSKKALE
jgi:hypothetical protein